MVEILETKLEELESKIHNRIIENTTAIENLNEKLKIDLLAKDVEINKLNEKIELLEKKLTTK